MKWIVLIVAIFLRSTMCHILKDEVEIQDIQNITLKNVFHEIFKDKCDKVEIDPFEKFKEVGEHTLQCIQQQLPTKTNETEDSNSSEGLCMYKKNNIRQCMDKMIDFIKECSEPEEKYFPEFVFDVLDNLMDTFCINDKIKNIDDLEAQKCFDTLLEDEKVWNVCSGSTSSISKSEDNIVTKEELCTDLESIGKCYGKYITEMCPKDKHLKKIFDQVHKAIIDPCHKSSN